MKTRPSVKRFPALALAAATTFLAGCQAYNTIGTRIADECKRVTYDGEPMKPDMEHNPHFYLGVPRSVSRTGPIQNYHSDFQRTVFSGFAVPPGTNLESKELVLDYGAPPADWHMQPLGHFIVDGTTFTRTKGYEHSAGHVTMHILYTPGDVSGFHFDFIHRAVDLRAGNPKHRLKSYDEAAQINLTKVIMGTYEEVPIIVCYDSLSEDAQRMSSAVTTDRTPCRSTSPKNQ